jgi:hypothetical protein
VTSRSVKNSVNIEHDSPEREHRALMPRSFRVLTVRRSSLRMVSPTRQFRAARPAKQRVISGKRTRLINGPGGHDHVHDPARRRHRQSSTNPCPTSSDPDECRRVPEPPAAIGSPVIPHQKSEQRRARGNITQQLEKRASVATQPIFPTTGSMITHAISCRVFETPPRARDH